MGLSEFKNRDVTVRKKIGLKKKGGGEQVCIIRYVDIKMVIRSIYIIYGN